MGTLGTHGITLNGEALGSRQSATLSGAAGALTLTTSSTNPNLTWTGGTNGNWNTTATGNWASGEVFNADDFVLFDGTGANQSITVGDGYGVQVAGMRITGGNYTFSNGAIHGVAPTTGTQTRTGKLEVTGGSATFNNAIDFVNGIDVSSGAAIELGNGGSFGSAIVNAGTVRFNRTENYTLTSNIAGGNVIKTNTGKLTLNAATMSGTFTQELGTVELAASRTWTGDYTQTAGTLTGSGTVTGDANLSGTVTPGLTHQIAELPLF